MSHGDTCECLECFMVDQVGRVQAELGKRSARMRALLADKRKRLRAVHDEMIVRRGRGALPNLDYYDNR